MEKEITEFTSFNFSTEEYAQAYAYTEIQLQGIQTQLCKFAQQKMNLDPNGFPTLEHYARAQEYNRGLMDSMRYLLEIYATQKEQFQETVEAVQKAQEADMQRHQFLNPIISFEQE
jgi:hypothetical protein